MKQLLLTGFLLFSLNNPVAFANEAVNDPDQEVTTGFGIGMLIGGVIAGPPGAVIGAAIGSGIGSEQSQLTQIDELKHNLNEKKTELNHLVQEFAQLNSSHQQQLKKVRLENQQQDLTKLSEGISLSIYFRTDNDSLESRFIEPISRLAKLIQDQPQIKIHLSAHADKRGNIKYNQILSRKRAIAVLKELVDSGISNNRIQFHAFGETQSNTAENDLDAYVFDRRVDLLLTLHDEA